MVADTIDFYQQLNSKISNIKGAVKQVIETIQKSSDRDYKKQLSQEVVLEVQLEISKIVVLLQKIEQLILKNSPQSIWWEKLPRLFRPDQRKQVRDELLQLIHFLELAINSLHQPVPDIHFAKTIRMDVKKIVCKYEHNFIPAFIINKFTDAYNSPSTSLKVIFGLISAVTVYGSIFTTICIITTIGISLNYNRSDVQTITNQIEAKQQQINAIEQDLKKLQLSISGIPTNQSERVNSELNKKSLQLSTLFSQKDAYQRDLLSLRQQLQQRKNIYNIDSIVLLRQISWAVLAGTIGSIVSILIRIEEFQGKKYKDPLIPFLIGFVKPFIGISFGILFLTLINSKLIVITGFSDENAGSKKEFLIFAVAFIVGFSERIAKDAIGKTEEMLVGSQASFQSKQINTQSENYIDGSIQQQTVQEHNVQIKQELSPDVNNSQQK